MYFYVYIVCLLNENCWLKLVTYSLFGYFQNFFWGGWCGLPTPFSNAGCMVNQVNLGTNHKIIYAYITYFYMKPFLRYSKSLPTGYKIH